MKNEYLDFLNTESVAPPQEVSERVISYVRSDLQVSAWKVFSKIALIHFVSSLVTLSFCPQFGVRLFGEGMGIMKYFMAFGTYGCMAACGAFFVGTSLLSVGIVLKKEEFKKLREHQLLQLSVLISSSLGAFVMADAEIVLGFALAWVFGSFFGGLSMIELAGWIRGHRHRGAAIASSF